jgi:hypothetical protein
MTGCSSSCSATVFASLSGFNTSSPWFSFRIPVTQFGTEILVKLEYRTDSHTDISFDTNNSKAFFPSSVLRVNFPLFLRMNVMNVKKHCLIWHMVINNVNFGGLPALQLSGEPES